MHNGDSTPAQDGCRSEHHQEPCTEPDPVDSWTNTAELLDLCELVDSDDPLDAFTSEATAPISSDVGPPSGDTGPISRDAGPITGDPGPASETKAPPTKPRIEQKAPTAAIAWRGPHSWRPRVVGVAGLVFMTALLGPGYRSSGNAVDPKPAAEAPKVGRVSVTSVPAAAEAWIDGIARGVTPLALEVPAGSHTLELRLQGRTRTLAITVNPGSEAAHYIELGGNTAVQLRPLPVAPSTGSAPAIGWMTVKTPIVLEAFEDGRLLGTTAMDRIAVAAGRHKIEFVNGTLGFRRTQNVRVDAGRTLTLSMEVPKGVAHINALPWAEVTVDREAIGETPVGNLALPIGPHEVVLRHPQYGERRHTIIVTTNAPVKLGVDLRK
jgi:hypothetical protein